MIVVIILSTAATILVLIFKNLEAAAYVAALVTIPLTVLSVQLDSGRDQRIAVITALVGVLAVVATLVIVRQPEPEPEPGPTGTPTPGPTETPTTTPEPPSTPTTTPPPEPTPPPPPPTPDPPRWVTAWKGPFRLQHLSGIDVDTAPPSLATGPADNLDQGDLFYDDRDAFSPKLWQHAALAMPESNTRPDAKACDEALGTLRTQDAVDPQPGQYLCLGTASGRLARLEVTDVQQYDYVRFNVIVWKWRK